MLTGLKVSSLTCLYYTDQNITQRKDPLDLNFEGLEIQKWNILTDRVQRAVEKIGSFV